MKSIQQRLTNIEGQIGGVKKMIATNKDCVQILIQLKAIRSAISGVMDVMVEEKFETCMKGLKNEEKKLLVKLKTYVKSN